MKPRANDARRRQNPRAPAPALDKVDKLLAAYAAQQRALKASALVQGAQLATEQAATDLSYLAGSKARAIQSVLRDLALELKTSRARIDELVEDVAPKRRK